MSVKIGSIFDVHCAPASASVYLPNLWGGENRVYSNAAAGLAQWVTDANAATVDFNFSIGDLFDGKSIYATDLVIATDEFDSFTDPVNDLYHAIGNHDRTQMRAANDIFTDLSSYWGAVENKYYDLDDGAAGEPWAYTFDRNGFRFIVCFNTGLNAVDPVVVDNSGNDQLGWLEDRLDEAVASSLPVVIFSHFELQAAAKAVVVASGVVQMCISGHDHRETAVWENDILYFNGYSRVRNTISITDTSQFAHHVIEIDPMRYTGTSQMRALINITGYGWGSNHDFSKLSFGF